MPDPILLIGLDPPEVKELKPRLPLPAVVSNMLPTIRLVSDELQVRERGATDYRTISRVVFHGIFEDDLPLITTLALWGGPCYPNALGMLDCRERVPNLARCRAVSRFASLPRSYGRTGDVCHFDRPTVAKWGEWHCGEGKERFTGEWRCELPTLFEPFIEGEAVRVQLIGDRAWQIRMTGDDWKKSIHGRGAALMPLDKALLEDVRKLQSHFRLEVCAADYVIARDGEKHFLELNHIPNVTEFEEIRTAYLDAVVRWAG